LKSSLSKQKGKKTTNVEKLNKAMLEKFNQRAHDTFVSGIIFAT
jgi:hypothetical protein